MCFPVISASCCMMCYEWCGDMIILCIAMRSIQQNKPRSNRRGICRERSGEKSPLRSYFFRTTTINFVMGNSKKQEGTSAKSNKKKELSKRTGRHVCPVRVVVSTRPRRLCVERLLLSAVASAATGIDGCRWEHFAPQ